MKRILLLIIFAMTSGCAIKQNPSEFFTPPSAKQQNKALSKHLKNVWYVQIKQVTTSGQKLIADVTDEGLVSEFTKAMRVTQPAMLCYCRGDIFFVCHRTDGTMIELWYEPSKLSGSKGSDVYGVPTDQFNDLVNKFIQQGDRKTHKETGKPIIIR